MKVLFTTPEKYNEVIEWYSRLNDIQRYRKICDIFDSPIGFKERFNIDRHGAGHTIFYFDKSLPATFIINCFKTFVALYGEESTKEFIAHRMRMIDVNRLLQVNTFDNFTPLLLDQETIDNIIRTSRKPFTCKSLL